MDHQDQELLEQHHRVEQVELEVKLIVQQGERALLIEVVAAVEYRDLITQVFLIMEELAVQESLF